MKRQLTVNLQCKKINTSYVKIEDEINEKDDLSFNTSLLSGYKIIGVNRIEVCANDTKSKAGGFFSHYLKCNNYDSVKIKGISDIPVFIYINKEFVEIYDAKDIFFMNYKDSKETIKKILGEENIEVCGISTAGAHKLDFAKIMFGEKKSCGKDGLGKIMGEKNVKAIVVKKEDDLKLKDEIILNHINEKIRLKLNRSDLDSYFFDENNCYGCNINCESTSIKKLIKMGIDSKTAEVIDTVCNEYGMDSITFAKFFDGKEDIYKLADNMMKNPSKYKINHNLKKITKEENIFDKLGFCRFLINKDMLTKDELDELTNLAKR